MNERWLPSRATTTYRPESGQLIGHQHSVWRVVKLEDAIFTDADYQVWGDHGFPDRDTWQLRPYRLTVRWVGGAKPPGVTDDRQLGCDFTIDVAAGRYVTWYVYRSGRWPQCSCCGEPMPCRAELEDRQVSASLERVAKLEAIPQGACWACKELITTRQKVVTYPGDNVDLPGGAQPRFHMRRKCRYSAQKYEERWLAVDPRRERILTWPKCGGILIVHGDGSSECVSGTSPIGTECESHPDCRGHLTHDHAVVKACYVESDDVFKAFEGRERDGMVTSICGRGCSPFGHPGTRTTRRPERRMPEQEVIG